MGGLLAHAAQYGLAGRHSLLEHVVGILESDEARPVGHQLRMPGAPAARSRWS
jgi:hypothetical protein